MKTIQAAGMNPALTQERLHELLHYDPVTGTFTWRVNRQPCIRAGDVAGMLNSDGYWALKVDNVRHLAHRAAWLYVHGRWPKGFIDHINGLRSDNRLCNLREATRSENARNKSLRKDNKSGVVGVHFDNKAGKWKATGGIERTVHVLGWFSTKQEAINARESFIAQRWGEFAPNAARRISDRIAPLAITAEGLASLGFADACEADFPAVAEAIVAHLGVVRERATAPVEA